MNLKEKASGQWEFIFSQLAPELSEAVDAAPLNKKPGHVACPVHGGSDGFRLYKDWHVTGGSVCNTCGAHSTGIRTLAWLRGWDFRQTASEVHKLLEGDEIKVVAPRVIKPSEYPGEDYARNGERIKELLSRAVHFAGTPAETYLQNRGIRVTGREHLGFVKEHEYWHLDENRKPVLLGSSPVMVAKVVNPQGRVVSVHRTYITSSGYKAEFPEVKKLMAGSAPLTGSLIRMYDVKPGDVLGLTEGIETAGAIQSAFGIPVWPCISASLLSTVLPSIPKGVRVVIFADLDRPQEKLGNVGAGQYYAVILAKALRDAGYDVRILMPKADIPKGKKGVDWLDVWVDNPAAMRAIKI